MIYQEIIYFLIGLVLMWRGGDLFVDASVQLSRLLRISRFIIGGTIVSIATTVPELITSVFASWTERSGMAVGGAIGSCITNIGMIAGVVAIIMPIEFDRSDVLKRATWMVLGAVLVVLFSWDLTMSKTYAGVLLIVAFLYFAWNFFGVVREHADWNDTTVDDNPKVLIAAGRFLLGASFVGTGGYFLVESGDYIATWVGIPDMIMGLSGIAIGTSLPELVTGVKAARRGIPDLSLGNIIGANVLNLFLVLGAAGVVAPLEFNPATKWYSFSWLGLFSLVIVVVVIRHGVIRRAAGMAFLLLFSFYCFGLTFLVQ